MTVSLPIDLRLSTYNWGRCFCGGQNANAPQNAGLFHR